MRFLLLTQYYPPEVGAAQVRLSAFARELGRAGHDVEVVTALPNYPAGQLDRDDRRRLSRREVRDGIRVRRMWLYPATGAGFKRLASYLSFTATGFVGALRARRPDVVFVESPPLFLGIAGWAIARRFGARLVINISDLWPDSVRDIGVMENGPWLDLAEWLERWLYRTADGVTAVTDGIRQRLIGTKGLSESKVLFLPNGIDPDALPGLDDAHASLSDRPTILYTGNHGYAQGLDVIVGAAELAPEIDFVLVGDGSEKHRLQQLVADREIGNVRFDPSVPSEAIPAMYARATAGVASLRRTTLMEGARPAKLLAIMASGRPVIYSGAGEGGALVQRAEAGIVVEPEDPAALADAAQRLASDPAMGYAYGRNGRAYVEAELAWPRLVAAWLVELDRLLR